MIEHRGGAGNVTLVDILDRVLDKGLVVAGDVKISLANVELLTIQVRLLVCSIDKAQEIGLDWWRRERYLSSGEGPGTEAIDRQVAELQARIAALEQRAGESAAEIASERPARRSPRRSGADKGESNGG